MKPTIKHIVKVAIAFCLAMLSTSAEATHLMGGYITYQRLAPVANGNIKFKIQVKMYRDCSNDGNAPFTSSIEVGIYYDNENFTRHERVEVPYKNLRKVDPPGNVNCDFWPSRACIQEGIYEFFIDLPVSSTGYHIQHKLCCRNKQTNLRNNANGEAYQGQTYYAFIPPLNIENSNPDFGVIPTPFMCSNDTTSFFYRAFDRDGDSLVYKLADPWGGSNPSGSGWTAPKNLEKFDDLKYVNGYNHLNPFGSDGYANVDLHTGITDLYTPIINGQNNYVVAIDVFEYRDGKLLSATRLDLQIIVIDCPPNKRPQINSTSGGENEYTVMAGEKICFDVFSSDPDGDGMKLEGFGDIFEGTNGYDGPEPTFSPLTGVGQFTSEFCWQTTCDMVRDRPYIFTIQVEDNGCPPKFNNEKFSITVIPFKGADDIDGPSPVCSYTDGYTYTALNETDDVRYEWSILNGTISGSNIGKSISVSWGDPGTGRVSMREISKNGCFGDWVEKDIIISPSPSNPTISGKDTVCQGEMGLNYVSGGAANLEHRWVVNGGAVVNQSGNQITVDWGVKGDGDVKLVVINDVGCPSDTITFMVNIRKPSPELYGPVSICPNAQNIEYMVTNPTAGSQFTWAVVGGNLSAPSITKDVAVNWGNEGPGSLTVVEEDRFGCISNPFVLNIQKEYNLNIVGLVGETSVCEFDAGEPYSVPNSTGSVYNWTITTGNQMTGDSSSDITVDWGAFGLGRVEVVQTAYDAVNDSVCVSLPAILNVQINPIPTADEIEGPVEICQYTPSVYHLNGFSDSYYLWAIDGDTTNIPGQGTNTINLDWPNHGLFKLSVLELSGFGCPGTLVDTMILIHPKPIADSILGENVVCIDHNVLNQSYNVVGYSNSTYNWQIQNGTFNTGTTLDNVEVNWFDTVSNGYLSVTETSEYGCVGDEIEHFVYIDRLKIDLDVISVGLPDDHIIINWSFPTEAIIIPDLNLDRTIINGPDVWTNIASVKPNIRQFIDQNLNTDDNRFIYRLTGVNQCGLVVTSDLHTNIQLSGESLEDYSVNLNFTDYLGWDNGIESYEIYERTPTQNYELIGVMAEDPTQTDQSFVTQPDQKSYFRCFRIRGIEFLGKDQRTFSNESCFFFDPKVFVPTGFTPTADGLNESFRPYVGAVKTYTLTVYNRWGQKLYQSQDTEEGWDGHVNGKPSPMGVYVYLITFEDHNEKTFTLNGTFTLLR